MKLLAALNIKLELISKFPLALIFPSTVMVEPSSVIIESSNCVPLNLTTLFVTMFVGLKCVAETYPTVVKLPAVESYIFV